MMTGRVSDIGPFSDTDPVQLDVAIRAPLTHDLRSRNEGEGTTARIEAMKQARIEMRDDKRMNLEPMSAPVDSDRIHGPLTKI